MGSVCGVVAVQHCGKQRGYQECDFTQPRTVGGVERLDAVLVFSVPLFSRSFRVQRHPLLRVVLRVDDGFWQFLFFLHQSRFWYCEVAANVVASEFFGLLVVFVVWQYVYFVLHQPTPHVLFFDHVFRDAHWMAI